MFTNLKVGPRLALGFSLVLGIMVAIIAVSLGQSSRTLEKLQDIVRVHNVQLRLANNLIDAARESAIAVRDTLLAAHEKSDPQMQAGRIRLADAQRAYSEALASLEKIQEKDDREEANRLRKLDAGATGARQLQNQVIELALAGNPGAAVQFMNEKTYPFVRQWIRETDDFIAYNERETATSFQEIQQSLSFGRNLMLGLGAVAWATTVVLIRLLTLNITRPLKQSAEAADRIARGDLSVDLSTATHRGDELGMLVQSLHKMVTALQDHRDAVQRQSWLKIGISQLHEVISGDPNLNTLAARAIGQLATTMQAPLGLVYVVQDGPSSPLELMGSYANHSSRPIFQPGEGLVGQAALDQKRILLSNVPGDYLKVTSGLGERIPSFLAVWPFAHEGRLQGVLEIGTLTELTELQIEYLELAMPILALATESAQGRSRLARTLEESQVLSEELQAQQEELQVLNEELEERNELLGREKSRVEKAQKDVEAQARELTLASKYKSDFLANMSHELRTPLNSLLLLAQSLWQNPAGNLTSDQVESAQIIYGSGRDLLSLINEILDLSKIEAGKMDLQLAVVHIGDLAESVRASFRHMAQAKGLRLDIAVGQQAPLTITSDRKRIEQVLRNLLSNAIKFTEEGSLTVTFGPAAGQGLTIAVQDTGIGIATKNHRAVFEAFQQVDGGTSRAYEGTGLGLSISRELAHLLGGELRMQSQPGEGSTFTLVLPPLLSSANPARSDARLSLTVNRARPMEVKDDRDNLRPDDRVILVIEDDADFAGLVYKTCHEKNFKCLVASSGEAGLELADRYQPQAVILDIGLPGKDGWAVLTALKEELRTRHIPVHVVSALEGSTDALRRGAVGHSIKPISREELDEAFRRLEQVAQGRPGRVLLVEDNSQIRQQTIQQLEEMNVAVDEARTGQQALAALRCGGYECVILDLQLPDMSGSEVLDKLEGEGVCLPPVIVHTARDLTREEEMDLRQRAESIVVKDVRSQERLLDEVSLFLHCVANQMPEKQRKTIWDLHQSDEFLRDKKVLIVDDDMRTTFAMSNLLSQRGMHTLKAESGERAIKLLGEHADIDLVLMDIMMPVMDGYETMKRIRQQDNFGKLPIIALTAKAMPEDCERCLAAGANDYLRKPVDPQRLISMLRVWLCR